LESLSLGATLMKNLLEAQNYEVSAGTSLAPWSCPDPILTPHVGLHLVRVYETRAEESRSEPEFLGRLENSVAQLP
jgi:hypothetical protein